MLAYKIVTDITRYNPPFLPRPPLPSFEGSAVNFRERTVLVTATMELSQCFSFPARTFHLISQGEHANISDGRYSRRRCANFLINNRIISIALANLCIHWPLGSAGILSRFTKFVNNRARLRDSHIGTRNLDNQLVCCELSSSNCDCNRFCDSSQRRKKKPSRIIKSSLFH